MDLLKNHSIKPSVQTIELIDQVASSLKRSANSIYQYLSRNVEQQSRLVEVNDLRLGSYASAISIQSSFLKVKNDLTRLENKANAKLLRPSILKNWSKSHIVLDQLMFELQGF